MAFFSRFAGARSLALGLAAITLGTIGMGACSAESPDDDGADESYQNHTVGQHIQKNSKYLWVDTTYDDAERVRGAFGEESLPGVPDGDPVTLWLQAWTDRIDAVVRADLERKTGQKLVAPKPVVKVLRSSATFNAWVTSLPACTGVPFNLASGETAPGVTAHVDTKSVQAGDVPCVKTKGWSPKELVTVFNTGKPECELSYDTSFHAKAGCPGAESKGEDTTILATTPHIRFATDLLAHFRDERSAIVVVAHELAHYYRAHGSPIFAHKYGFWYDQGATVARRPVPAQNAAELEALYREVLSGARPIGGETWQTKVSARVRPFLLDGLGPLLVQRADASFVCAEAAGLARAGLPGLRPGEIATPAQQSAYVTYENALLGCVSKWRIVQASPAPNEIAADDLKLAIGLGQAVPPAIAPGKSVGDVVAALQNEAVKKDAAEKKLLEKLRQNRIGLYTTEQEADDLAMELSVRVGLDPTDVLAGWVGFLEAIESYYADAGLTREEILAQLAQSGDIDAATCKSYLDAGFVQADKKTPITVTIGSIESKHHTSCYRLYNLWREARAHKYVKGPAQKPLPYAWETLRKSAETYTKTPSPPSGDAGTDASPFPDAGPLPDAGPFDAGRD